MLIANDFSIHSNGLNLSWLRNSNQFTHGDFERQIDSQKFQSTAGLLYVQGSADGHRLKHVLKHARDIPDKNIHDVFDGEGDRDTILAWIDIAYEAGKKGGRGTKVERQGGRVVYTVKMSQRIGYVGGRAGRRDNFPECRYLRLVVQNGNEVVTAYPSRSM